MINKKKMGLKRWEIVVIVTILNNNNYSCLHICNNLVIFAIFFSVLFKKLFVHVLPGTN